MKRVAVLAVLALLLAAVPTALLVQAQTATVDASVQPEPHAPILIEGNEEFTEANGVRSGNGTPHDPYRIDGWFMAGPERFGVKLVNTTAHVVIENITIAPASFVAQRNAVELRNVSNVTLQRFRIGAPLRGIVVTESSHVTIRDGRLGTPMPPMGAFTWPQVEGIYLLDSFDIVMEDVLVENFWRPMFIADVSDTEVSSVTFHTVPSVVSLFGSSPALITGGGFDNLSITESRFQGVGIWFSNHGQGLQLRGSMFLAASDAAAAALEHEPKRGVYIDTWDLDRPFRDLAFCGNAFQGYNREDGGKAVYLTRSENVTLRGNMFRDNSDAIYAFTSNLTVERNHIEGSTGTGLDTVTSYATVRNNTFEQNDIGAIFWGSRNNLSSNWWGSVTGPSGHGPGEGDEVYFSGENNTYRPWLESPPEAGPDSVDCGDPSTAGADPAPMVVGAEAHLNAEVMS